MDDDNDFTPAKPKLPTLEQIAEQDEGDIIFELDAWDDDENDSLDDPLSFPQHKSISELLRPDIENPDPFEIVNGTAGQDDDEEEARHRPKLWATAMAVSALVGLGAVKVLENSSDLDDIGDFNNSFSNDGGGGAANAGAEGSAAKAGGEGGAAKAGADAGGAAKAGGEGGAAKAGGEYGAAKASGDGVVAKGGDTAVSRAAGDGATATKSSSDGIGGGGGGKAGGNDTGAGGKAAGNDAGAGAGGNDTGGGGARPRTQQ